MEWLTALALAFSLESREQKKEDKKRRQFLESRRKDLGAAVSELTETISNLIMECGPIGLGPQFVEQVKLAPFYAIGEVLSAQGDIFPEQESCLKIMFANIDPIYNYAQFTEAAIHHTGVYQEYKTLAALENNECGSLWLTLFELIYRSRLTSVCQKLDDQLSLIVINFANLGIPDSPFAEIICNRILNNINYHIKAYQQTPYIHALMLLQVELLEKRELAIEKHFFIQGEKIVHNCREYYVFAVYEKRSQNYCGKFAVKEIRTVNGKLDYQNDDDHILVWNESADSYEVFYQE